MREWASLCLWASVKTSAFFFFFFLFSSFDVTGWELLDRARVRGHLGARMMTQWRERHASHSPAATEEPRCSDRVQDAGGSDNYGQMGRNPDVSTQHLNFSSSEKRRTVWGDLEWYQEDDCWIFLVIHCLLINFMDFFFPETLVLSLRDPQTQTDFPTLKILYHQNIFHPN